MPAPSKVVGATSISKNVENVRLDALGLVEVEDVYKRPEFQLAHGPSQKEMDVVKEDTMALVMVDKDKLQLGKLRDGNEVENRLAEEKKDGLSALIKDWSGSSRTFWRRDSCEFTTCVSPCVKKATSHLQQLQEHLIKWSLSQEQVQEVSQQSVSRNASSAGDIPDSLPTPYSETRTLVSEEVIESSSIMSSPASEEKSFFSGTQELSFTRPSSSQSPTSYTSPLVTHPKSATPVHEKSAFYRMGSSAVEEVLRLLGRLERDRIASQQMLVREKQRVSMLRSEIDRLAFKRLTELPAAVQKEHESCTTNINELKWHCSYQGRVESRIKRRVFHAETQHAKFIEDVKSSRRSCPLVKEKLELESQAMASIRAKQDETDEELGQTMKRLDATEINTNEAKKRASQERILIKQDVDVIRNLLNEVSDELAQLKMNYTSNVHTISDIKNTLKENAEQCHNLEKREERVKTQEASQQSKVVTLREKIAEQGSEHVRLKEENEKLRKDNLITEGDYQTAIAKLKVDIKQHEIQVRELSRKNKAMREEMDSTSKHTAKCKKQKISDKKALVRAGQEVEKIIQQNEMMSNEIKTAKTLNQSLKTTKAQQEEENFIEEDSLKSAESSLRGQVKEEAHSRTVLQARIAADTSDLLRSRVESKKKREKVNQQSTDTEKVVSRIKEQVSKQDFALC